MNDSGQKVNRMNKIEKVIIIAEQVRKELGDKYGADNLYGKCIEASDKNFCTIGEGRNRA